MPSRAAVQASGSIAFPTTRLHRVDQAVACRGFALAVAGGFRLLLRASFGYESMKPRLVHRISVVAVGVRVGVHASVWRVSVS